MARTEVIKTYSLANSRLITVILRDTIVPEDPYISLARAKALSLRTNEPYNADRVDQGIKYYLIKTNITV
jgi:hypothetical protein